ncbi:MAG: glycosyltransferase [Chitinispirillaceae bacterium]
MGRDSTLNIAFFGSSLVSAFWNGAATYYRGLIRALADRGHSITFYEPDAFERQQHRDIDAPPYATSIVYPAEELGVRTALDHAKDKDVIIKASGVGVFDELLEKGVLNLKTGNNSIVFWDVDAPATLDRVTRNENDPFRVLIPEYDRIFTYGGGQPVVGAYLKKGARSCIPVYNALDAQTHYPVPPDPRFEADLGFLGNRMPDREHRVKEFFFKAADILPDKSFLLGGNGWHDQMPIHSNISYLGHVFTYDHNAFNCTPAAVLNISRQSMADYGFSPATRVFEAAGAGACLITDAWKGIEQFLEPDSECLIAHNGRDVANLVAGLDFLEAKRMGEAARQRVLDEHTYAHRAKQVENILYHEPDMEVQK